MEPVDYARPAAPARRSALPWIIAGVAVAVALVAVGGVAALMWAMHPTARPAVVGPGGATLTLTVPAAASNTRTPAFDSRLSAFTIYSFIRAEHAVSGKYPTADQMKQHVDENRDAWGRPISFTASQDVVTLTSNGPDGKVGTADDLVWIGKAGERLSGPE